MTQCTFHNDGKKRATQNETGMSFWCVREQTEWSVNFANKILLLYRVIKIILRILMRFFLMTLFFLSSKYNQKSFYTAEKSLSILVLGTITRLTTTSNVNVYKLLKVSQPKSVDITKTEFNFDAWRSLKRHRKNIELKGTASKVADQISRFLRFSHQMIDSNKWLIRQMIWHLKYR